MEQLEKHWAKEHTQDQAEKWKQINKKVNEKLLKWSNRQITERRREYSEIVHNIVKKKIFERFIDKVQYWSI